MLCRFCFSSYCLFLSCCIKWRCQRKTSQSAKIQKVHQTWSRIFVQDDQRGDDSRHPSGAGEDEDNEHGPAPAVDDGQWREDDGKDDAENGHSGLFFEGFQCAAELVGTRCGFIAAADAIQFTNDIIDFLTCHQTTDPLQVAVATAKKGDLLNDALVIDGHVDELGAGALGFVEGVFHDFSFSHSSSCIFCRSRRDRGRCGRFYSFWRRVLPLRGRRMVLPPTHHSPIVARPPA